MGDSISKMKQGFMIWGLPFFMISLSFVLIIHDMVITDADDETGYTKNG